MARRKLSAVLILALLLLLTAEGPILADETPAAADPSSTALQAGGPDMNYTKFLHAVRDGQVKSVTIDDRRISGTYVDGNDFTLLGPESDPSLAQQLDKAGVDVTYATNPSPVLPIIFLLLAVAFLIVLIVQARRKGGLQSQMAPNGPVRAPIRVITPGESKVTFDDVAGLDEVKADLQELVDFLKHPDRYTAMGAKIPKGVLFFGPPGTGKTLLARAVAGEAGVNFILFSASQFVEVYVGVGASRVRELFAQAKRHKPCIIFIDELDAVGRHRGTGLGGNDEREQTLNQMLVEMDGFENSEGIVVMAATNRSDVLDRALLRPGRFDRQMAVDAPDLTGRRAILSVHASGMTLDNGVSLEAIARRTPGFTGADLANLLNEAALQAVRCARNAITWPDVEEAMDRVMAGGPAKQNRLITPSEKHRIAVHEAGHALAARLQPDPDPVHKVTVIPRGRAGGFTITMPDEDKRLHTRTDLIKRLVMLLAGRAAEALLLGEASNGAQDDLNRAFALAQQMVAHFGMSEVVGPIGIGHVAQQFDGRGISEELAAEVDRAARALLQQAAARATALLEANKVRLARVSATLMEKETIDGKELDLLLGGVGPQLLAGDAG